MSNFVNVLLFFLFFFLLLEAFKRCFKLDSEYTRKFAHIFAGSAVILLSSFLSRTSYLFLTLFFFFFLLVSRRKKLLSSFSSITRKTYGELTYLLGIFLIGYFFFEQKDLFISGLLILIFPDALAGLFGYQVNKYKKTLLGSFVYFITAFIILLQIVNLPLAITLGLVFTAVEFLSRLGLDNLTVPLAYIIVISLLF